MTILTRQSHITKASIKFLNALLLLSWKSFHWRLSFFYDILLLKEKHGTNVELLVKGGGANYFNILFLLSKLVKCILNFSFSSRKLRIFCLISLSLLETREREFNFLFLLSKLEKWFSNFSFSSRNWRKWFQISLSPLEMGEIAFKFLFLFSNWLFCLLSTTGLWCISYLWQRRSSKCVLTCICKRREGGR